MRKAVGGTKGDLSDFFRAVPNRWHCKTGPVRNGLYSTPFLGLRFLLRFALRFRRGFMLLWLWSWSSFMLWLWSWRSFMLLWLRPWSSFVLLWLRSWRSFMLLWLRSWRSFMLLWLWSWRSFMLLWLWSWRSFMLLWLRPWCRFVLLWLRSWRSFMLWRRFWCGVVLWLRFRSALRSGRCRMRCCGMRCCPLRCARCVGRVRVRWRFRSGAWGLMFACRSGVCLLGVMFWRRRTCWSVGAASRSAGTSCVPTSSVCRAFTRCTFVRSGSLGRHYARTFKVPWSCRRRYRRLPVVHGSKLAAVRSRCVLVLGLYCYRRCVLFVRVSLFLRRRSPVYSTRTVKAGAVDRRIIVDHRLVVNVVNLRHVHEVHRPVVEEIVSPPIPALITFSAITVTVIDPAIEADVRSPVTCVPYVHSIVPSPITGCPQEARHRRKHPCAGHPVVIFIVVAVRPIARRPNIIFAGTNRLYVHGQRRGRDNNGYSNTLPERYRWYEQHHDCQQQPPNGPD